MLKGNLQFYWEIVVHIKKIIISRIFFYRYRCLLDQRKINIRGAPTKEISRVILESFRMERDDYALGASKVFMRENLETVLEKHRQDIQEVNVLIFQHFQGKNNPFLIHLIWFLVQKIVGM